MVAQREDVIVKTIREPKNTEKNMEKTIAKIKEIETKNVEKNELKKVENEDLKS